MPLPTFDGELRTGAGDRGADDGAPLDPGAGVAAGAERSVVAVVVELTRLAVSLAVELLPLAPGFAPVLVERWTTFLAGRPAGLTECPAGLPGGGRLAGGSLSATNRPENAAAKDGSVRAGRGEDCACIWVVVAGVDPSAPAAREIKNAAPKAAKASTVAVDRSLTTPTA